jgi:hypothetical protein
MCGESKKEMTKLAFAGSKWTVLGRERRRKAEPVAIGPRA